MPAIFVRHGRSLPDPALPAAAWPLDPDGLADIVRLAEVLPALPVVSSDMARAVGTARFFGKATIDPRLREVDRPYVTNPEPAFAAYLAGQPVDGWEPQALAVGRLEAVVADHGEAIYVTHGTVLTLFLASRCPDLDPAVFWAGVRSPDAWSIEHGQPTRLEW